VDRSVLVLFNRHRSLQQHFHDSFGLLPQMSSSGHGKRAVLRFIGLTLVAFAVRFALAAFALFRLGGIGSGVQLQSEAIA
jgi:hypothetical protein